MSAAELYRTTYGRDPDAVFSAPGRVNLIGEHTDYNGGLVLPFAIDARASVAAGYSGSGTVRVVSAQRPGEMATTRVEDIRPGSPAAGGWPGYLLGAFWSLTLSQYPIEPVNMALDSQVPAGAGLSSSAAVECAAVLAISTLAGHRLKPLKIARLAQRVENGFVGVPCGPMDQTASAACQAGSVLLFDTRTGAIDSIPFDPTTHGLTVLVVDIRVAHSLADGEYGKRRASCEKAAEILGVPQLRDVSIGELSTALGRLPDDELRHRVRHVVTENDRVVRTAELLRDGQLANIGELLTASHTSLREDYQVSCAELDLAVDTALATGALGARMTGGGFGGSVIALVPIDRVDTIGAAVIAAFDSDGAVLDFDPVVVERGDRSPGDRRRAGGEGLGPADRAEGVRTLGGPAEYGSVLTLPPCAVILNRCGEPRRICLRVGIPRVRDRSSTFGQFRSGLDACAGGGAAGHISDQSGRAPGR